MDDRAEKLSSLKKKQAQLKAQIQALESAEKSREKKRETRRKILIGAFYFDQAKEANQLPELYQKLEGYLVRDTDRLLFNLHPLAGSKVKKKEVKNNS